MRKIIPPKSSVSISPPANTAPSPPAPASEDDNDIATMLTKSIEILRREIRHLMYESAQTKLSKGSSTDLVNYIKLLSDLHDKEKELVSAITDEELKRLLHEAKSESGSERTPE
jgi:hypothetical protein